MCRIGVCASIFCCLIAGCSLQPHSDADGKMTASATATTATDGSIEVRQSTSAELASVNQIAAKTDAIDQRYPAPNPPPLSSAASAVHVSAPGVLELSDGRLIQMDGVRCTVHGAEHISKFALNSTTKVVFSPSETTNQSPVVADVWLVNSYSDSSFGPSFSPITEVALINGWCAPDPTSKSKLRTRYVAIFNAFEKPR